MNARRIAALRDWPMQRKLVFGVAAVSLGATLLAGLALFGYQVFTLRAQFRTQIEALARLGANYAAAPVSFGDRPAMRSVLSGLKTRAEILDVRLYDANRSLLATAAENQPTVPAPLPAGPVGFDGWLLRVEQPVTLRNETLGTIRVDATFRPVFAAAAVTFSVSLFVVLGAVLLGVGLATLLLARLLLHQLQVLSAIAERIGTTANYQLRAPPSGADEVGRLTTIFNGMLDRLERGDADLRREIAERNRLEVALVAASRSAGKAEVASGVLHNVGNVLNSVNVSANLLRDGLSERHHLTALLAQTGALLRAQPDLAAFLTHDPRGGHLHPLLLGLTDELALHHRALHREVLHLAGNIDHIKQIVSVQQSYAKSGGIFETFPPAELFTAALAITRESLQRDPVTVVQNFTAAGTDTITTDRHHSVEILVNFIANALAAVKLRPVDQRHIRLTVLRPGDRWHLMVEDNGVGIAAENLHRIFQHGFTTRRDGHGFGLHSGALTARRLGGEVLVHSDGPDRGARFILNLPSVPPPSGPGT